MKVNECKIVHLTNSSEAIMKTTLIWFAFFLFVGSVFSQEKNTKTLFLKSGEKISGQVIAETDSSITLNTAFGELTIAKDKIKPDRVTLILKNGDVTRGVVLKENADGFTIQSGLGVITVPMSSIERIDIQRAGDLSMPRGVMSNRWYFSDERLIDMWFDPTGFPLEEGVFYISGFSFAYGFNNRFQLSTRWANWFAGDLNFRPKFMIFQSGDVNKMRAFSVGGHFHLRGSPEYKWHKESWTEYSHSWQTDASGDTIPGSESSDTYANTEWFRLDEKITMETRFDSLLYDNGGWYYSQSRYANYDMFSFGPFSSGNKMWGELFFAYTVSKLKSSGQGRINYNLGASFTFYPGYSVIPRYYAGLDYDARTNLKLLLSVFYDEYFVPIYYQSSGDSSNPPPLNVDLGFIYARDEHWRIGLHFQRPTLAVYYKF